MKKIIAFLSITALIFCGCSNNKSDFRMSSTPASCDIFAMDTYMNLKAYGGDNTEKALNEASDRISELEALLSVTDENSDIWKINHANGSNVSVNEDALKIIDTAISVGNQTNGALDITVYPIVKQWGFTTGEYKIPDSESIASLLENVNYQKISIDSNNVSIPSDFQIDLGALAKGYTGDKVMEIFKSYGIESAIISLGGNVQSLGSKPDGSPWSVAVINPFKNDENMCIIKITDKAVVTSGNYERYFIGEDGNAYWHIIDSKDGYPADNGLVSVTIIGDCGLICDALSTALFVAGLDGAEEFWRNNGGFDMILVTDEQKIYITEEIEDCFTSTCDMQLEVIRNE